MNAVAAQQPEVSKFGAWEIQFTPSTANVKACALVQKVMSEEQPNVGLMVAVRKGAEHAERRDANFCSAKNISC